jgi:signal transduction histidine kinase/DNA-binding response OmpR family regulator
MKSITSKLNPRSVKRKILAGFLLAFIAILLAFTITHLAFRDMLTTVDELSEPSSKLTLVNRAFQEITTLDQLQRAEAIRNPKISQSAFLNHSQKTINLIDSMMLMDWDSLQRKRINSMKDILQNRDSLFFSYLKLKSDLIDNKSLTKRIDTLSTIIEQKKVAIDSSVVTTEKKTTTTYVRDTIQPLKDERNFFGKIFGKKKKTPAGSESLPQVQVQQEFSVVVDTVAIARQNEALEEVEKIVLDLEQDQRTQGKQLLSRELELINTNSLLVTQLLTILREVETEEVHKMHARSYDAGFVVNESIKRISIVLLLFFLGAALLVYLIWTDISRSNYYKEQLEKARDEAEELSLIKQRFLANMSHEIRTPLQSIIGFAEHIKHRQSYDREAVDAIYSSSEHLLHIVNEVLDYSRISSGHFTLAKEDFELMSVIKEVESAMRIQSDKKKLSLLVDVEHSSNYTLSGDSFRLRQILYNVLGNAVKFTTNGYVKLSVRTKQEGDRISCEFEIRDTGIGIRPEDINKIFNQFEQADTTIARNFGGTGLGLTIVKSLIEALGGNLRVESQAGLGSTFTILLAFDKATHRQKKTEQNPVSGEGVNRTVKLLVVDDDPMILRLCGLILDKNEITHTLYEDAEELLHKVPDDSVTHVLMDIRMPKINGVDLCKALRKKYSGNTKFVALTAHVFAQDKKHLHDQGFDFVLSKPFHEEELLNLLGISSGFKRKQIPSVESYVVDLSPLRKITMNDESLFQSVIQQFLEETEKELELLDTAIDKSDKKMVREIYHKMSGRIGQMGIVDLSRKLREVEMRIEKGEDLNSILPIVSMLKEELKKLMKNISRQVPEQLSEPRIGKIK